MEVKLFEVRDRATFIPVMAVKLQRGTIEAERYLLSKSGYTDKSYVVLWCLSGGRAVYDEYDWGSNITMRTAHEYIRVRFDGLRSGDVIDAEYIRGESDEPVQSESADLYNSVTKAQYHKDKHGHTCLVLNIDMAGVTDVCPFCDSKHTHGLAGCNMDNTPNGTIIGHRVAHCAKDAIKLKAIAFPDGNIVHQNEGYYLKLVYDGQET